MRLHKKDFWLSNNVVALHLDNSNAKVYSCNHCNHLLFCRLACHTLNLADMYVINLLPTYLPTYLNVEAGYNKEGWLQNSTFFTHG